MGLFLWGFFFRSEKTENRGETSEKRRNLSSDSKAISPLKNLGVA